MTDFKSVLKSKDFIVTAEARPVKGADTTKMAEYIDLLKGRVDAIDLADNTDANMAYSSLGACLLAKEHGAEAVLEMTCRDRNRIAIQSDLLCAYSRGIKNVLCLTGDVIDGGDHKQAKPVFDIDSVQLIHLVHALNDGKDLAGNPLDGATSFCIGAVAAPAADPIEPQLLKLRKKFEAGVDFIQTRAVYDLESLKWFMERARKLDPKVKIIAGIGVPKANNENVPESMKAELARGDVGIAIAGRLIKQIKVERMCDGVHLMVGGKEKAALDILKAAGL